MVWNWNITKDKTEKWCLIFLCNFWSVSQAVKKYFQNERSFMFTSRTISKAQFVSWVINLWSLVFLSHYSLFQFFKYRIKKILEIPLGYILLLLFWQQFVCISWQCFFLFQHASTIYNQPGSLKWNTLSKVQCDCWKTNKRWSKACNIERICIQVYRNWKVIVT